MTNNNLPSIPELAAIAADAYYDDLTTIESIAAYTDDIHNHDNAHDNFADDLADDIADLLHNRNEPDLFPFLADADESLADALIDFIDADSNFDDLITELSRIIFARIA